MAKKGKYIRLSDNCISNMSLLKDRLSFDSESDIIENSTGLLEVLTSELPQEIANMNIVEFMKFYCKIRAIDCSKIY